MQFMITDRYPAGGGSREEYNLAEISRELLEISKSLDGMVIGETVTIERLS